MSQDFLEELELIYRSYPQIGLLEISTVKFYKNDDNAAFYIMLCLSKMVNKKGHIDSIISKLMNDDNQNNGLSPLHLNIYFERPWLYDVMEKEELWRQ